MNTVEDYWAEEDFEETVAAALIACFETKVKKNRGAAPSDRLTDERVRLMRNAGPYIASNSRILIAPDHEGNEPVTFDVVNDPLPHSGCFAWRPKAPSVAGVYGGYLMSMYIRQATSLGKYWFRQAGGTLYESLIFAAGNDGISGERFFFTVTKGGNIVACDMKIPSVRGYSAGSPTSFIGHDPQHLREREFWSCVVMQMLADKRFCWTITAQEESARAHLGCMQEEVKSLLYARNLPMTSTGRKRPILHLVEAHKRRMRSGTDVDVSAFLRGQQTVEIGGTVFKVSAPASIRPNLSDASIKRFYEAA